MRVSNPMMAGHVTSWLSQTEEQLFNLQSQAASGKRILHPSDDPAGTARALSLRTDSAQNAQRLEDIESASFWLKSADSTLQQMGTTLTSLRDLAVAGASTEVGSPERQALLRQAETIESRLLDLANTKVNGRYLFAGQATTTLPFAATGGSPAYSYSGSSSAPRVTISTGLSLEVGLSGDELFNVGGTVDPSHQDLLSLVNQVTELLRSGDGSSVSNSLSEIDYHLNRLVVSRGELGARLQTCETVTDRLEAVQDDIAGTLSTIEDADLTQVVVDLTAQQNAMQAAASVAANLNKVSLLDYLR